MEPSKEAVLKVLVDGAKELAFSKIDGTCVCLVSECAIDNFLQGMFDDGCTNQFLELLYEERIGMDQDNGLVIITWPAE